MGMRVLPEAEAGRQGDTYGKVVLSCFEQTSKTDSPSQRSFRLHGVYYYYTVRLVPSSFAELFGSEAGQSPYMFCYVPAAISDTVTHWVSATPPESNTQRNDVTCRS